MALTKGKDLIDKVVKQISDFQHGKVCAVYSITNPEGEMYIGVSINLLNRYKQHKSRAKNKYKGCIKLYRSFLKFGFDSHKFEIIEKISDNLSKLERELLEGSYIVKFNTFHNGLNSIYRCPDTHNLIRSEEWKRSQSKSHTGLLAGVKHPLYKIGHTEASKKKMSELAKGKYAYHKNPRAKKVFNTKTGEIYLCAKEASEKLGFKVSTLRGKLGGYRYNNTDLIYVD